MIYATFTEEMRMLLHSMIGKKFSSYECGLDERFFRAFGNVRINVDTLPVELTNEEHSLPLLDGYEDMTYFSVEKVDSNFRFEPDVVTNTKVIEVNKVITSIEIVTDSISVNKGEYQITFDAALIFHMGNDTLMFARDAWFSELITIKENDEYDNVFPIQEAKESWSNDGELKVEVQRSRNKI